MRNRVLALVVFTALSTSCEELNEALRSVTAPTPQEDFAPSSIDGRTLDLTFHGCGLVPASFVFSGGVMTAVVGSLTFAAVPLYSRTSRTTATLDISWRDGSSDRFALTFSGQTGGTFDAYIGSQTCNVSGTFRLN